MKEKKKGKPSTPTWKGPRRKRGELFVFKGSTCQGKLETYHTNSVWGERTSTSERGLFAHEQGVSPNSENLSKEGRASTNRGLGSVGGSTEPDKKKVRKKRPPNV